MMQRTICFGCMVALGDPSYLVEVFSQEDIPETRVLAKQWYIKAIPAKQDINMSADFAGHPVEFVDWARQRYTDNVTVFINKSLVGVWGTTRAYGTDVCARHAYWLFDKMRGFR